MAQSIVEKVLEKYGFKRAQEEGLDKFFEAETTEKAQEILDSLPGAILSQILWELEEKKLTPEELPEVLRKNLNVSQKIAKEIAKDLEEKQDRVEEKPPGSPPMKGGTDAYREPIE